RDFHVTGVQTCALPISLFLLFSLYAGKNFGNPNSVTRIGLSHALATRGELTIDGVARHTMDKAFYRGHYYCDKAPGISLLCVPRSEERRVGKEGSCAGW